MSAPIGNTCPDIDKAIRHLRSSADTEGESQIASMAIDYLEELRSSNSTLREWGEALEKEHEKELEEKLYDQRKACADTWYEWRGDKESTNDLYNAILEASV